MAERLTPNLSSSALASIGITTSAAHSRRNSRRNTPSTSTLAQQLALAMALPGSTLPAGLGGGLNTALSGSLDSGLSQVLPPLPSSRPLSRRNTPSSATIQAYLEAAQLGTYNNSASATATVDNFAVTPMTSIPEVSMLNLAQSLYGHDGSNDDNLPLNHPAPNSARRQEAGADSSDGGDVHLYGGSRDAGRLVGRRGGDGDHGEHADSGNYTMVRDNLSESGISVSSETYNYNTHDHLHSASYELHERIPDRPQQYSRGHVQQSLVPTLQLSQMKNYNDFGNVVETSHSSNLGGGVGMLNAPISSKPILPINAGSSSKRGMMIETDHTTSVMITSPNASSGGSPAPSAAAAAHVHTQQGQGPQQPQQQQGRVVTTPMSSLRSIFAMVADEQGEVEGDDLGNESPYAPRDVRRQLLFQDN
jgi:hypothetical protein